jgi:hypothetical protein
MIKNCLTCQKEYNVKPSHYDRRITCSRNCNDIYRSIHKKGENNPNWKNGGISKVCKNCKKEYKSHSSRNMYFCCIKCYNSYSKKENHSSWNGGKPKCLDCGTIISYTRKRCRSCSKKRNLSYQWKGGVSFKKYGFDFNKELKEIIRKRDNYQCQKCMKYQEDLNKKLIVHHRDEIKKNNDPKTKTI